MKNSSIIWLLTILATILFIGLIVFTWVSLIGLAKDPAPRTYETGLYVESEQVQQTIDGRELQ